MKKRLEAELISIAHQVLRLKGKSDVNQLYRETQKLYEALSVLKFYQDNFEQVKSSVSETDLEEKIAVILDSNIVEEAPIIGTLIEETETPIVKEDLPVVEAQEKIEEVTTEVPEPIDEKAPEEVEEEETSIIKTESDAPFEPIFELAAEPQFEDVIEEKAITTKQEVKQISFDDLLGSNYSEPVFVKPSEVVVPASLKSLIDEKPLSLNDKLSKTINIGLNDRMAFVKHLFDDNTDDYNRVLSQLNTFSTFTEAKDFVEEIIKPDYNNWTGNEEYAERFLEIVANKFS